jgi:hypothetical protein
MILAVTTGSTSYASSDAYDSGYDHGCDDAGISNSDDRYINQPEKGPSFHTDRVMDGYNNGFDACSDNDDSQAQSQSQSQDQSQSQSQSQNNEQTTTIINCPPDSKCVIEQ